MDQLNVENKLLLKGNHLKDIILHSLYNKDTDCYLIVSPSRFRKILSDYYTLNAITPMLDVTDLARMHKSYRIFSSDIGHKDNNNTYTVIKNFSIKEYRGRCTNCDCVGQQKDDIERWINGATNECYYKEALKTNYTTKIKLEV